jgi:nicotinate dehydrogenase subunit B
MTTLANIPLSRRDLLTGGALIVGFNVAAPLVGPLSTPVRAAAPDPAMVDSWIAVHADNTATIFFGKVELGQGTTTGMLQIAGEELDLTMSQLSAARVDTDVTPNQGPAVASLSIMDNGPQLRAAAAEARQALLRLAAAKLGAPVERLKVLDGIVSVAGEPARTITYGDLIGDRQFNVKMTGKAPQKPVADYRLVGTRVARVDIPDKVSGKYVYMQHVRVPNMLHGRIVRPRGQGAYGAGAKIASVAGSIAHIPGARVVRKGDFLGVVAEQEWDAVRAADQLKVAWQVPPRLPAQAKLFDAMRASQTTDSVIVEEGDVPAALAKAAHVASATYHGPYQAHAPFAPSCALADVDAQGALANSPMASAACWRPRSGSRPIGCGCNITRAPACSGAPATTIRRSPPHSCRKQPAGRCASSSCAGTSTAGTTTARRISPTCAPASMRTAISWRSNITAGTTAGRRSRPPRSWRLARHCSRR